MVIHPSYAYLVLAEAWLSCYVSEEPFLEGSQLCRTLEMGPLIYQKPALDAKTILAQRESWPYLTFHANSSEARPLQEVLELPGWRIQAGMGWTLKITACAHCTLLLVPMASLV